MPISVTCPGCSTVVQAHDGFAGKKGKCQKCGGVLVVPVQPAPPAMMVPCPHCMGDIVAGVAKCRHCGEFVNRQEGVVAKTAANLDTAKMLSLFIPGAGQMYREQVGRGLCWMLVVGFGYCLCVPGLIAHYYCYLDAGSEKPLF